MPVFAARVGNYPTSSEEIQCIITMSNQRSENALFAVTMYALLTQPLKVDTTKHSHSSLSLIESIQKEAWFVRRSQIPDY
jgi:hypothetical protein